MKVLLGFTCGGVQRNVTGGEPLVGQTLVRNKDNGQEVGGGGSGRGHVRATEPTTQCWVSMREREKEVGQTSQVKLSNKNSNSIDKYISFSACVWNWRKSPFGEIPTFLSSCSDWRCSCRTALHSHIGSWGYSLYWTRWRSVAPLALGWPESSTNNWPREGKCWGGPDWKYFLLGQ